MKKTFALLLAFVLIFSFAACKSQPVNETTTEEPTGKPGDWVTDTNGEVQTITRTYVITEKSGEIETTHVTDANGKEIALPVTTFLYDIETHPGATQPPTSPPGYTMAPMGKSWPADSFFSALPVLSENVDDITTSKKEAGEIAILCFNEVSYADYLKYIEECKAAGFEQTSGDKLPEKETDGESYIYYSVANGLYVTISYNTDSAPHRNCDVRIIVTNYDVVAANQQ